MSLRKLIFITIVLSIFVWTIASFWILGKSKPIVSQTLSGLLNIWIVGDTTEGYDTLIAWFRTYAPEYKNTPITFKKFSDYPAYQKILLSTLADGNGPDIFMVEAGADTILRDKVEPIPSKYINISDFEKHFDDVFLSLIESTWSSEKSMTSFLRWVPLGYETLGIFYNKSLVIDIAKTWDEISLMYTDKQGSGIYPTNIGLSERYTPFASDILGYFLLEEWISSYDTIDTSTTAFEKYFSFGESPVVSGNTSPEDIWASEGKTLSDIRATLDVSHLTTLDMFIRWKIAFVVGYPGMMSALEDGKKRAGKEYRNTIILTAKIPQDSLGSPRIHIAKYNYFWLSKMSKNSMLWVRFLDYLTTEDAEKKFITAFPHYIPAQRNFYESASSTSLSSVFPQAKLDSFIPQLWERVLLFDYGNKKMFEEIFSDTLDRNEKIDKNNVKSLIKSRIRCEILENSGQTPPENCTL